MFCDLIMQRKGVDHLDAKRRREILSDLIHVKKKRDGIDYPGEKRRRGMALDHVKN